MSRIRPRATVLILFEGVTCAVAPDCDTRVAVCLAELRGADRVDIGFAGRGATVEPRAVAALSPVDERDRDRHIETVDETDVVKVHAVEGIKRELREGRGLRTDGRALALGATIARLAGHPAPGNLTTRSCPHTACPVRRGGLDGACIAGGHRDGRWVQQGTLLSERGEPDGERAVVPDVEGCCCGPLWW